MPESIQLGYWGIRGRAQIIRLLLSYTGVNWTQKKYLSQDQWKGIGKDQTSLGLPFPNLPYIIQGDFKLTQSRAIMNYIIRISQKKQLSGKDLKNEALIQNIVTVFNEILSKCIELVYTFQNFQTKQTEVSNLIESKLQSLSSFSPNNNFILGDLTLADFIICECSYYIEKIFPNIYAKYSILSTIRQSFENLTQIKNYYESQNALKGPFLTPTARIKI